MRPKGKLFALFAIFAAIGLVTATGAFTTVQADRTVNVQVSGDSSALLVIDESSNAPSVVGSSGGASGEISFTIGSSTGLNENATTVLTPIVNVTNNGNEAVNLTVSATSDNGGVTVVVVDPTNATFSNAVLTQGQNQEFGLRLILDDSFSDGDSFTITLEINAEDDDGA